MIAKALGVALGCDTSENLTPAHYAFLRSLGYAWICRYVPLAGQSHTAPGILQPAELASALAAGFGVMLVQIPRTHDWTAANGLADGTAAAAYARSLGYPPTACLWLDLNPTPNSQTAIDYSNAWLQGVVAGGMATSSAGVYMEPGVPLTSQQRYSALHVTRYWATAANDPARFPTNRGCQLIQLWGSKSGQMQPELGLVIDADVSQLDYFGTPAIAAFA